MSPEARAVARCAAELGISLHPNDAESLADAALHGCVGVRMVEDWCDATHGAECTAMLVRDRKAGMAGQLYRLVTEEGLVPAAPPWWVEEVSTVLGRVWLRGYVPVRRAPAWPTGPIAPGVITKYELGGPLNGDRAGQGSGEEAGAGDGAGAADRPVAGQDDEDAEAGAAPGGPADR